MEIDARLLDEAVDFLNQGSEIDAARTLQACSFMGWEYNDSWMAGSRRLDGVDIEVAGPRSAYEILTDQSHTITKSVMAAISAVLPTDTYLKTLRVRALSSPRGSDSERQPNISEASKKELIEAIDAQKALMIAVSTGGPRINTVNQQYEERRTRIRQRLSSINVQDPNPFQDLWTWYGKWSDGSLPTYQSRRQYVSDLYRPLIDALQETKTSAVRPIEPTGWARVDRNVEKIGFALETAQNEEDFQAVALLCREALISLAQAVYKAKIHGSADGVIPSQADAKRMLEAYIATELAGQANEYVRKHARAAVDLAVNLQHKRTATFRDAALCTEATRSIINAIAILSGQRDPVEGES